MSPPDDRLPAGPAPAPAPAPASTSGPAGAPGPDSDGIPAGPGERLRGTPLGTRIVTRTRIVSGFTDTLGTLVSCDGTVAVLDTRTGPQQVVVAHVVAMRVVPPPPARRRPAGSTTPDPATPDPATADLASRPPTT